MNELRHSFPLFLGFNLPNLFWLLAFLAVGYAYHGLVGLRVSLRKPLHEFG